MKDRTAAPALIALVRDEKATRVRAAALTALCTISGQDFGEDVARWTAWEAGEK